MAKKATKKKAATPPKTEAVDQEARKTLLVDLKEQGWKLADADKTFKADREVMLTAVQSYGSSLQYADETLQAPLHLLDPTSCVQTTLQGQCKQLGLTVFLENVCCNFATFVITTSGGSMNVASNIDVFMRLPDVVEKSVNNPTYCM